MSPGGRPRPGPSSFGWELFVNLGGAAWGAVIQILCIPVYVRLLGVERFALIAFATTMLLVLKALDFGLSHTINRELARRSHPVAAAAAVEASSDLLWTFGLCYVVVGLATGGALVLSAPRVAESWFRSGGLGVSALTAAVRLIGVLIAVQWPLSFYQGALFGLRRASAVNAALVASTSLAAALSVGMLLWGERSLSTYLHVQIAVAAAHTSIVAAMAHRCLPSRSRPPRFRPELAAELRDTVMRAGWLTTSMLLLLQADKLVASRWLSLDAYGHYMLGAAVSTGLAVIGVPLFATFLPRLAAVAAARDGAALRAEFARGTRLVAVLVFPVMIACSLLSRDLLRLWMHDAPLARAAAPATAALLVGTGFGCLLQMTMALQLATGDTRTGVTVNLLSSLAFVSLGWAVAGYGGGAVGAVWATLMMGASVAGGALVYRRQIGHGAARWLLVDLGCPILAMGVVAAIALPWTGATRSLPMAAARLIVLAAALMTASALAAGFGPFPERQLRKLGLDVRWLRAR